MPVERWWSPPPFWRGETAFILGGGPSLRNYDLAPLAGRCVVALNNAWYARPGVEFWRDDVPIQPGPWPIAFFNDGPWFRQYGDEFRAFPGLKCTVYPSRQLPGVAHIRRGLHRMVDEREGWLGYGNDAGVTAILLLQKLGVRRIGLLAYDHRVIDGRHNWHMRHQRKVPDHAYAQMYRKAYADVAPRLAELGVEAFNCTPGSELKAFPFARVEDLL